MKGGHISYNLRPNKFVERLLFIDLIGLLSKPVENYVYISLGGPQLEDLKLMHYRYGFTKLISLEADPLIYDRQVFNARPGCIDCRLQSVDEFIANFTSIDEEFPTEDYIIWLDYAAANERYSQLSEFQSLISTLNNGDIVKITMNANVTTVSQRIGKEQNDELQERRFDIIKRDLEEYFDLEKFNKSDLTRPGFLKIMRRAIDIAAKNGIRSDLKTYPILSFYYQDGPHIMINVAYKIHDTEQKVTDERKLIQNYFPYLPKDDSDIKRINIPNLSVKERLHIDEQMFKKSVEDIHSELPFRFSNDISLSLSTLQQYFDHYRRYPNYLDVKI